MTTARRAVFLDKDGTLIDNVPYNVDPALIRLAAGAAEGLPLLRDAGFRLFIVSNQSGVARGFFPESALAAVEARLGELLAEFGVRLDAFLYCPHHPEGTVEPFARACDCRKPAPGMILSAARAHGIDLAGSWMVGDQPDDVGAGRRAGCRTVLVGGGGGSGAAPAPDYRAADLAEAARLITSAPPV